MNKLWIVLILTAVLSCTAFAVEEFGDWTVAFGQGYLEHIVRNGPGNELNISCDEGATEHHEGTSIHVQILGKSPPPDSGVVFIVDAIEIRMFTDKTGTIQTDCHVCSDNFEYLWTRLRKSKSLLVQLADGRSSSFSLKGVSRALEKKACRTGYTG